MKETTVSNILSIAINGLDSDQLIDLYRSLHDYLASQELLS